MRRHRDPHGHEIKGRAHVIDTQVPDGLIPPSTSMHVPPPGGPMADLPSFSGDNPPCIKCGFEDAHTRYVNHGGRGWTDYEYPTGPRVDVEHLQRECNRCGYTWPEAIISPQAETK